MLAGSPHQSCCRRRRVGLSLLVALLLATILASWLVSYSKALGAGFPSMIKNPDPSTITSYLDSLYTKPYARAGAYLIGLLVGLFLAEERQMHLSRCRRVVAYAVTALLLLLVLFGKYHSQADKLSDAFYNSLSRVAWAFVVCLIVILNTGSRQSSGSGSLIHSFLSFACFVPLSKLTYCAYLIHPLVINFYYRTLQEPLIYTGAGMLSIYASNVVMVFLVSLPVYLVFEAPFARLLRLFHL